MDAREQILSMLRTLGGEKINVCGEIYEFLRSQGGQAAELLQFFFEASEGVASSREKDANLAFTKGEVADLTESHGKIVDGILENLLKRKPGQKQFYSELWEKLNLEGLFENDRQRIFALYYLWIDIRLPYFEIPEALGVEEEQYRLLVNQIRGKLQKARFILASEFKQWTQMSRLLLELMEDMESKEEKTVFLACIMQLQSGMAARRGMDQ